MLDIIIPHYDEPWEVGKPYFDMLACQRGVDFDSFKVLLIHDGVKAFPQDWFACYPYKVEQHRIVHGGVSEARNFGLALSDAEWVTFSDFDDTFTNIYALRGIMSCMDKDVDYMWTPFFVECMRDGELGVKIREENLVWVHGKYFRRKFLNDNNIRFPVGIHYSEDSAFCALVNEIVSDDRRGKIKLEYPAYSWVFRKDSVSTDPANRAKNMTGFIDRNTYVVEEFKRRGINHIPMVGRMFADAYWAFHQVKYRFDDEEKRFAWIAQKYVDDLKQNKKDVFEKILKSAKESFKGYEIDMSESFGEWLKRLEEMRNV